MSKGLGEIRMVKVVAAGRLVGDPVQIEDGTVHFLLQASEEGKPIHCFCSGKTAENVQRFRHAGDECSLEGELRHYQFQDEEESKLLVFARHVSYGRKRESLQPGDIRGGIIF